MKAILTTSNSDDVSGTTILDDGTKLFWGEGRGKTVVALRPTGKWQNLRTDEPAIWDVLNGDDYGTCRPATLAEEHEHALARAEVRV